jgi:hypothetical protein
MAGAALGGAISYLLSRQQIKEARAQRLEAERSEWDRRSVERRLDIYGDFLTRARSYRNAIRQPNNPQEGPSLPLREIADLARAADPAGSLVHLVTRSRETAAACGKVMRTIGNTSGTLYAFEEDDFRGVPWEELNEEMSTVLRSFQSAGRAELGIDDAGVAVV